MNPDELFGTCWTPVDRAFSELVHSFAAAHWSFLSLQEFGLKGWIVHCGLCGAFSTWVVGPTVTRVLTTKIRIRSPIMLLHNVRTM